MRHLLLVLLALGLVVRMGAGCEAMAASVSATATHQTHCADMPAKPDKPVKPVKADVTACALCAALPDSAFSAVEAAIFDLPEHASASSARLAGLVGGPVPPPPRIA
ncbi:MAG TPA: hypothetical protein VM900_10180 [Sphingomonas sp.]|nr:hypothetical protein [Sphingomonas sp.]